MIYVLIYKYLELNEKIINLGNLLLDASKAGLLEKVKYYISNGADVNLKDKKGQLLTFISLISVSACPFFCP